MGRVREVDRVGNDEADAAAALGRKRVHHSVSVARGVVVRSCARWYPVVRDLHRFFIAIARSVVNDDGGSGTSLHPVIWSNNSRLKRRRVTVILLSCLVLFLYGLLIGTVCLLLALMVMMFPLGPSQSVCW